MHGVAKWIEDSRCFKVHSSTVPPQITHWQHDVLCECPRSIYASAHCMCAQVPAPGKTVAAASTGDMTFSANDFARMKIIDVRTDRNNLPHKFVPHNQRD